MPGFFFPDKVVTSKKYRTFFNSIKIIGKYVIFSYLIKLYEYWGNFQSPYETETSSMEKITRLILEEVIMSDRHMSNGQMYSFCKFFIKLKKLT